jgi:TonB-dependent starch-binding outer membrane protein SusC
VGSTVPVFFGGLNTVISWKQLELSATITGKFKYYFRRGAINYSDPFSVTPAGEDDYAKRWRAPGQENTTTVPSFKVNSPSGRDLFYANSEATVEKADQLRLQELKLSYNFRKLLRKNYPVRACILYLYASNIGPIWKATNTRVDPDFLYRAPVRTNITIGARFEFQHAKND